MEDVTLLPPIPVPEQDVICLGINYMAHAEESARFKNEDFAGERPHAVYFSKRVARSAAELAYFLVLSFFPFLICLNAFIGQLHLDINTLLEAAAPVLPREALEVLGEYVRYITENQSPGLLAAGGFMTLFSSSAAFRALMNIMEDIYERKSWRGLGQVLASVGFSVLFLVTIYLSLVVLLTGEWLFQFVEELLRLERDALPWDWQWMRFFILFCLVLLFVLLV